MHLRADDIEVRTIGLEIGNLARERPHVVLIHIQPGGRLHVLPGKDESVIRVVRGHHAIVALGNRQRVDGRGLPFRPAAFRTLRPVRRGLVDDIPAVDTRAVAFGDFLDALLVEEVLRLHEARDQRGDFGFRELRIDLLPGIGPRALVRIAHVLHANRQLPVATRNGDTRGLLKRELLVVRTEVLPEPSRRVPGVVAPHEGMSVDAEAAVETEVHDRIRRRTTPVRLVHRTDRIALVLAVPVILGVLIRLGETGRERITLERAPIEGDGRRIEERSVELLVAVVPFGLAKLVVVEDVRTKEELVGQLLNLHLGASRRVNGERGIALAILLDVRINALLDIVVPKRPILLGHDGRIHLELRVGGESSKRDNSKNSVLHMPPLYPF